MGDRRISRKSVGELSDRCDFLNFTALLNPFAPHGVAAAVRGSPPGNPDHPTGPLVSYTQTGALGDGFCPSIHARGKPARRDKGTPECPDTDGRT